jgi:tetratricopeptide (TPR) repeat protein
MRSWLAGALWLCITPSAYANTYCAFGTCGEIGTVTRTPNPQPQSRDPNRGDNRGSSSAPSRREPPPVDEWVPPNEYQRAAVNAAQEVNDAYEALQAGKYDKAISAYTHAAAVYEKLGAAGPRTSALHGLAAAEHDKALALLKKAARDLKKGKKLLDEARGLFIAAVRDNPSEAQLLQDREDADRVTPGWCVMNRPLVPQANTMSNEFGIVDSAETICQKKAILGKSLACDWAATFEAERCIVSF